MLIFADENIPFADRALGSLGEVRTFAGRGLAPENIRDADALIVRSVTRVNESLLKGSRVRFVGTATIGSDHIDVEYLRRAEIAFATAEGCNAESVAQWVAAALARLSDLRGEGWRGGTIGIVGVGRCGSRVERVARGLGMEPILCDPPLARATGESKYRPLSDLRDCDAVTLHVPLIREGADRTIALIGEEFLKAMKPGAAILNASRGGVIVESELLRALNEKKRLPSLIAALDVWENEPNISMPLLEATSIATPHIAGYSLEGKARGTEMIHDALAKFVGVSPTWRAADAYPDIIREIKAGWGQADCESAIGKWILQAYPITRDDAELRKSLALDDNARSAWFDSIRKNYPTRREFPAYRISPADASTRAVNALRNIGFTVA